MSEEMVIRHCAPTLASIKTANLFSCAYASKEDMLSQVRAYNKRWRGKGICVVPLRYRDGKGLIYIYRPGRLEKDLCDETACRLLVENGYGGLNHSRCIQRLMQRLAQEEGFPHEIGLFLGYPPEDVDGFINRHDEAKCSGLWKVYGDVGAAEKCFAWYRKCAEVYMKKWTEGSSIDRLTVAV